MAELANKRWLRVYDNNDGAISAIEQEEPRVSAAVSDYLDSGKVRDRLLDLTMLGGGIYYMRASNIMSWFVSTPENRRLEVEHQAAVEAEAEANRADIGIWSGDG